MCNIICRGLKDVLIGIYVCVCDFSTINFCKQQNANIQSLFFTCLCNFKNKVLSHRTMLAQSCFFLSFFHLLLQKSFFSLRWQIKWMIIINQLILYWLIQKYSFDITIHQSRRFGPFYAFKYKIYIEIYIPCQLYGQYGLGGRKGLGDTRKSLKPSKESTKPSIEWVDSLVGAGMFSSLFIKFGSK